jgi:predicted RecA/RadA family phage recombinase
VLLEQNNMKNSVSNGNTVTFIAPSGGAISGVPLLVGALLLIPAFSASEDQSCEGATRGVYTLPKLPTDTPAQFAKAYWDVTNGRVTTTAGAHKVLGVFMDEQIAGTDLANVRLNGVSV